MKNLIFIIIVGVTTILANNAFAQNKVSQKVVFSVDMECDHCKLVIMKNIPYEKGVKNISVDVAKDEVTVMFRNDKITIEELIKAFEKIGYKAEVKKELPVK